METRPRFIVPFDGLEKTGIEPATLVYKASDITTAPRRLQFRHHELILGKLYMVMNEGSLPYTVQCDLLTHFDRITFFKI